MEHISDEDFVEEPIDWVEVTLAEFKAGIKKQPWEKIKKSKLIKLYKDWSKGIIDKELLDECVSIAIVNLRKILANSYILLFTDFISDEELDRWNEFISDEYGNGRYTEQTERFSRLLFNLINARTDKEKMIALDQVLNTVHGIGGVAHWFVEGGVDTLAELEDMREDIQ